VSSQSRLQIQGPAPFKQSGVYEAQIAITDTKPSTDSIKTKQFSSLWKGDFHLQVKDGIFSETIGSPENPLPSSIDELDNIWIVVTDLFSSLHTVFEVPLTKTKQKSQSETKTISETQKPKRSTKLSSSVGPSGSQGPSGDKGPPGSQGQSGSNGPNGPQGIPGDKGTSGHSGLQGDRGITGDKGSPGAQGDKGDKGIGGPLGEKGPWHLMYRRWQLRRPKLESKWVRH